MLKKDGVNLDTDSFAFMIFWCYNKSFKSESLCIDFRCISRVNTNILLHSLRPKAF